MGAMARLVRVAGRTGVEEVSLGAEDVTLGRGEESALRLFDETASRRHAVVRVEGLRVVVEDLASANGTRVNGARVAKAFLSDGDEIAIGDVRLRFLAEAGADRPTRIVPPATDERAEADDATVEASVDPETADPAGGGAGEAAVARMRLVCRAAEVAADAVDPDRLASAILDLLVESLAPDRAAIFLVRGDDLRPVADHPRGSALPPSSRTLLRRVLAEGEAVLVRDGRDVGAEGAGGGERYSVVRGPYRATLAAPLATVEGVRGLVTLESSAAGRFGPEDLAAVAAVARQAALALRTLHALSAARAEVRRLQPGRPSSPPEVLGSSPALLALLAQTDRVAATDATVLILGETGTGKELVARRIHAGGARRDGPFVALNCAAIVEGLLESEMFGHEKGAFTGADARREGRIADAAGGTLFLDEVGELSAALQAKLLRVLSDRTYARVGGKDVLRMTCRLVAATHRDLPALVAAGRFREDLWYRLAVVTLSCPPLRERGDDVEALAEAFLERIAARLSRRVPTLSSDARACLRAHRWPGNVRELENVLERALVLSAGDLLTADDLPREMREGTPAPAGSASPEVTTIREAEKRAVAAALARTKGKKGEAAALLGISWPTLTRKMREFGLDGPP